MVFGLLTLKIRVTSVEEKWVHWGNKLGRQEEYLPLYTTGLNSDIFWGNKGTNIKNHAEPSRVVLHAFCFDM